MNNNFLVTHEAIPWWFSLACICSVMKCGDQITLNCKGSARMTLPWSTGSVASKTEMKHPHLHYYRNLALRILHRSLGMAMYSGPRPVSNLSQIFTISGTRKQGRPRKTWSECVKTDINECSLAGVDPLDRCDSMTDSLAVKFGLSLPISPSEKLKNFGSKM